MDDDTLRAIGMAALERRRNEQSQRATAVRAELAARFPRCFMPKGSPKKRPLKLAILEDLLVRCPDITAADIHLALNDYTGGPTYHRACKEGALRVALDGLLWGAVTAEEAKYHEGRLRGLITRWRKRRNNRRRVLIGELAALEREDARDKMESDNAAQGKASASTTG